MRALSDIRGLPPHGTPLGRVRIVGGGLTGILAAFEAHRLGWRDITIHERFEALGGGARPKVLHGAEMRGGRLYFGGPGDPVVDALSAHGPRFETFHNRFGSMSIGADGKRVFTWDFDGPAIDCPAGKVARPADTSLAARLSAYPPRIAATLETYVRWHLDADPALVHGDAAIPLAIDRVFPAAADLVALAEAKAADPWADELYAVPPGLSGRAADLVASLPVGGFAKLFDDLHRALTRLGVKIELNGLVPPRQLMAEQHSDEIIVWAADPTPLFAPLGLSAPPLVKKCFFTYVYEVEAFDGPRPVYVQNFTAQGAAFRAYLYESGGKTLVAAECVREADLKTLPTELRILLSGFGALKLGPLVHTDAQPRGVYPSLAAIDGLSALRARLAERFGGRFIPGAWEPHARSAKLAEVNAALAAAREPASALMARAG
ncbi:FAD/NAD(P)-binding protein [Caulobacter sp. 1776]|uniref:NAD(P)-binding protein n=1 Tax=Caulobacter sp. 1776 TaxID=3156420 RepID=UPI003395BC33